MQFDRHILEESLQLLGAVLEMQKTPPVHLVVSGGSALLAVGIAVRTTHDLDDLRSLSPSRDEATRATHWMFDQELVEFGRRDALAAALESLGHDGLF